MEITTAGERLRRILKRIMEETGVESIMVFTMDGFPIVSASAGDTPPEELFSAIGAGLISLSANTLKNIGMLPLSRLTIESPRGNIVMEKAGQDIGVMAIAGPSTPIGMLRIAIQRARKDIGEVLGGDEHGQG